MIVRLTYILRRRWPVLAALLAVGALAGLLIGPSSSSATPTYTSTALVSADLATANKTEVQQALVEARKGPVAAIVADQLDDGTTPAEIARRVGAEFDEETYVATIRSRAATPEAAEQLARTFAEAFVAAGNSVGTTDQEQQRAAAEADRTEARAALEAFLVENEAALLAPDVSPLLRSELATLESEVTATEAALAELGRTAPSTEVYRLVNVGDAEAVAPSKLRVLESPAFRIGLGLVLGAIAAAAVIFVAERTNPRIDDPEAAVALVGAPVLGMIPRIRRRDQRLLDRVDAEAFSGPLAESFRTMRAHLDFRSRAEERTCPPRVMVTSATPGEGKTTTSAYLALSYVETDRTPVVIGGDLRRPSIHRLFGVQRVPGLTSRSQGVEPRPALTDIVHRDPVARVTVVPSGPPVDSVAEVLDDLKLITETAQASGQPVVLDTAPVRVANDAIDFLEAVDWVVVVVHLGNSTVRSVSQMMQTLRMNGAQVVGVALVGSVEAADASRDYYSYYAPDLEPRRLRGRKQAGPKDGKDVEDVKDVEGAKDLETVAARVSAAS